MHHIISVGPSGPRHLWISVWTLSYIGESQNTFYHLWLLLWHFLSLGVLNAWTAQETMLNSPVFLLTSNSDDKHSHPLAPPQETLSSERPFHFLWACDSVLNHWSKSWALFAQLEGEPVEALGPAPSVKWPVLPGVHRPGDKLEKSPIPQLTSGLILINLGFLVENKTGSWCI